MAEMHSLNFENLIANFIKIYLNPRCDLSNLNIISKKYLMIQRFLVSICS